VADASPSGISVGEVIVFSLLGLAALEIIKGVGEGIAQTSTQAVTGVFGAIDQGLHKIGADIASGYESLLGSEANPQQTAAEVAGAAATGANAGAQVGAMAGGANSAQAGGQ
jgi:hypothetical protein